MQLLVGDANEIVYNVARLLIWLSLEIVFV